MRSFRTSVKVVGTVLYTLFTYSFYLIGYGLLSVVRVRKEPWRNLFMRVWSIGVSRILNIRINTLGNPPKAPFFLVSNHLSYVDIIPLFLNLKCTFVAKKEVRSWPILGFMVMSVGVIFVDRTRKRDVKRVNEILSKSLNKYQGVIVFPEGTTSGGNKILPFRPPLLEFPSSNGIPVYYSSLRYQTDEEGGDLSADESVCFYGARDPFHKHVYKLAGNKKIDCTIHFCDTPIEHQDRKVLAEQLHQGVQTLFEPMK